MLDNRDYNADIAMRYEGGTKLITSGGTETTVTIGGYKDAGRTYDTDNSKSAANEDSYTMTPRADVFQNDRVLGEISISKGYLCDEHNYYITPAYADESWYIEKTAFADDRQAEGEQRDTADYSANVHLHRDNELAESQDQVMKGNVELSKHVSSTGSSDGLDLEGAGFTFFLVSDLSKEGEFATTRSERFESIYRPAVR